MTSPLVILAVFALSFGWIGLPEHFPLIGGLVLGAGVALVSSPGQSFIEFARESYREVRKVVWPTRKEAGQMTGLVFAFVVIMALFLWSADKLIEWVIFSLVLGWK